MTIRHLIVTPLPNGRSGNVGSLSVHLGPRLRSGGILQDYTDFADWGAFVTTAPALEFTVAIDGVARPAGAVTITSALPTASTWRALFGPPSNSNLAVGSGAFVDRSGLNLTSVRSSAATAVVDSLLKAQTLKGSGQLSAADALAAAPNLASVVAELQTFVSPVGNGEDNTEQTAFDFHHVMHKLGAHPQLMRALGLVFDLQVILPAGSINHVQVATNWPAKSGARNRDQVPMRLAIDNTFRPVVLDPAYRTPGWLALSGAKYAVVQLDTVNAATQLGHISNELATVPDETAPVGVPAVMEAGISIVHQDLKTVLLARSQRAREVEDAIDDYITTTNAPAPNLVAEDIALGYRVDAEDVAIPGFRSLHERRAINGYVFPRNSATNFVPADDEGWAQVAIMTDGTVARAPAPTTVFYPEPEGPGSIQKSESKDHTAWRVYDSLATWSGWSLSAPRPSNVGDQTGAPKSAPVNAPDVTNEAKAEINYAPVPDPLPRLRYGHTYRMRARTVDLAGNGPVLSDTADTGVPEVRFGRTLPVPPPTAVYRESRPDPGVGVAAWTLVIKSELNQPDANVAGTDRLLFPPNISQARLERHDLPNGGVDPAVYADLVTRDAASLAGQCLIDPETNDLVAGTAIVNGAVTAGPLKPAVTYLADPMVRGIAFSNPPGAVTGTTVVMPVGTWPQLEAVDLRLLAGTSGPVTDTANRRVTVRLPKGTTYDLNVACAPVLSRLNHMYAYNQLDATQQTAMAATFDAGLVQTVSAPTLVRLVHAVRIPLSPPSFSSMVASRTDIGQTTVVLDGMLAVHCGTTDRATLTGVWTLPIDPPAEALPREINYSVVAGDVLIGDGPATTAPVEELAFELNDTRRRYIELSMEGFCRYSRYFTERLDTAMSGSGTFVLNAGGVSESTVTLTNLVTGQVYQRETDYTVNRTSGSVTRVSALTVPDGTSLRAEFIPLPVSRLSSEAPSGQTFTVDVPASAAPLAPVVRAVVPAFARSVVETSNLITVIHDGRVLRALIERPWYSSGSGELLGVATDLATVATPVLTRWGRDPIWSGAGPAARPTSASFDRATNTLAAADGRFDVAGHTVTFDEERKVWTADILVDARFSYRPWVQLSLCRFQPNAVDGAHVSDPVECEPVRLGALRTVSVAAVSAGLVQVTLSGRDVVNTVRVITQQADPTITDPDLRWSDVTTTTLVRSGTKAEALFTGQVSLPVGASERRVIVEESEPAKIESGGALVSSSVVSYREVVDIPTGW
jgi:hypothetical protein